MLLQLALAKQPLIPPASLTSGLMAGGSPPVRLPPGATKSAAANGIYSPAAVSAAEMPMNRQHVLKCLTSEWGLAIEAKHALFLGEA